MLYLLTWVSSGLLLVFGTLCLAAGLFYAAELVEEYSVLAKTLMIAAKRVLHGTVYFSVGANIAVGLTDSLPVYLTVVALVAHAAYFCCLRTFPMLELDAGFVAACVMVVVHNYLTFSLFAQVWMPFDELVVPFGLFISLSVNDNALPSSMPTHARSGDVPGLNVVGGTGGGGSSSGGHVRRATVLKAIDYIRDLCGDIATGVLGASSSSKRF